MRLLDTFSGIGGFSLGMERAGFQTVGFCEPEKYCQEVLAQHWPEVPIYDDIRELSAERLAGDGIGGISVISGGFPCQDISKAGSMWFTPEGTAGKRSGLWAELCRLISEVRPRYAIMENVPNLLVGDSGQWFGRLLGDLASIRYNAEWHCIPATAIGAPTTATVSGLLPTPTSRDYKGAVKPETLAKKGRNPDSNSLPDAVEYRGESGKLNPAFAEWLMGYPEGFTALKRLETPSCPKSQK